MSEIGWIGRRDVVRLLGIGGAALAAGLPKRVHAAASGSTLVLGIDISDSITFDPAREAQYTAPLSLRAAYEVAGDDVAGRLPGGQAGAREVMGTHAGRQGLALLPGRREVQQRQSGHRGRREVDVRPFDQYQGSAVAVRNERLVDQRGRSEDRRYHAGRSDAADPDHPVRAEFRRDGAQGGGGPGWHRGRRRQYHRQGDAVAQSAFGRRRPVHHGRLDPRRADPADAQRALLPRAGSL